MKQVACVCSQVGGRVPGGFICLVQDPFLGIGISKGGHIVYHGPGGWGVVWVWVATKTRRVGKRAVRILLECFHVGFYFLAINTSAPRTKSCSLFNVCR